MSFLDVANLFYFSNFHILFFTVFPYFLFLSVTCPRCSSRHPIPSFPHFPGNPPYFTQKPSSLNAGPLKHSPFIITPFWNLPFSIIFILLYAYPPLSRNISILLRIFLYISSNLQGIYLFLSSTTISITMINLWIHALMLRQLFFIVL